MLIYLKTTKDLFGIIKNRLLFFSTFIYDNLLNIMLHNILAPCIILIDFR
jgi:hypothetical protein